MAKSENQMKGEPCPICFESFPENLSVSPTGNSDSYCFHCLFTQLSLSQSKCCLCKRQFSHVFVMFTLPCVVSVLRLKTIANTRDYEWFRFFESLRRILPRPDTSICLNKMQIMRRAIYAFRRPTKPLPFSKTSPEAPSQYFDLSLRKFKKISLFLDREFVSIVQSRDSAPFVEFVMALLRRHSTDSHIFRKYLDRVFNQSEISAIFCQELNTFLNYRCSDMAEFDELMVLRHDFSRLEKSLIDTAVLFMSEKSGASGAVPDFLFFPRFLWPMVVDKLKEHCKLSKRVKNADYYGKVILENGLGPPGHCDEDGEFVDLTKMDLDRL